MLMLRISPIVSIGARYFLALVALGISFVYYYSNVFYQIADFVYGSDSLYLPALSTDVLRVNNLLEWNLPPSSYLFPDLFLYFIVSAITPEIHATLSAFALAQYFIFAIGLILLARPVLPRTYRPTIPALIALTSLCFTFGIPHLEFYSQMVFVSAHHFGVVLITPFILALTLGAMRVSQPNRLLYLLGTLSFLTTLSDWLYLAQVAIPLAASLAILHLMTKIDAQRTLIAGSALIAPSLLGLGTSLIYILNRPLVVAYLFQQRLNDNFGSQLADTLSSLPLVHILLATIFLCICVWSSLHAVAPINRRQATSINPNAILPLYFILVWVVNVLVVAASGLVAARDGWRYFLPALIFSAFWGLPFIVPFPKIKPAFFEATILGILGLGILLAWHNLDWVGLTWEYHPAHIQCLDENISALGIRYGIANYWQARPISLLSQNNLRVAQVNRDLTPYPWINNSAEYTITPEFAVIDSSFPEDSPFRLDENLITSRFGKPDAMFRCDRNTIVVYRSNQFKFQFRDLQK